jgi:tetratricopeptide (TPR) repeat protein
MNLKRTLVLLLVVLLSVSCGASLSQKKKEKASIHYRTGRVYFSEDNYMEALKELTKAVELDPKNPRYQRLLGLTYFVGKKMYDKAIFHLRKAVTLRPGFSEAHMNLGAVYLELENWDMAIPHFKAALRDIFYRRPEWAYNNLGWAYYNKGQYRTSLLHYKKAVEVNPKFAMAYNNMGLTLTKLGETDEAVKSFETAAELVPDFPEPHYNLGILLMRKKDKAGALKAFERVVELAPRSEKARSAKEYIELIR